MPTVTFRNPLTRKDYAPISIDVPAGTTILEAAEECGARVGHACGGNLACSTCHVYVHEGLESLPDKQDKEEDIMDRAFDVRPESRLACQAKLAGDDVEVEITQEGHQAWLDENPDERKKKPAAPAPAA